MHRTAPILLAALLGCSRPAPSPVYAEARERWNALLAERGDEASESRQAEEVLAALRTVPSASPDAPAAQELQARIAGERRDRAAERARRAELVARAGESQPGEPSRPDPPGPTGEGGSPGASARPGPLALGTSLAKFQEEAGDCFQRRGAVQVAGDAGARPGEAWTLRDAPGCRERYPQAAGGLVVFADGVMVGLSPAGSERKVERKELVELGTLPDGGRGIRTDAGVRPLPEGATLRVLDGGPPR